MSENVLICPKCHAEYEEGFSVCSDCDVPLVRRLDAESGDCLVPFVREMSSEFVSELLDRLEKKDVPYVVEAGTALDLLDGEAAESVSSQPWEARVWVAESAEERAAKILEQLDAEWRAERGAETTRRAFDAGRRTV